MINMQEHLIFLTNLIVRRNHDVTSNIRGVTAQWKNKICTAHISFYFDGEPEEEVLEDASTTCGEIIAHIPEGFLEEDYFRLDASNPLPESKFWAYKRPQDDIEEI